MRNGENVNEHEELFLAQPHEAFGRMLAENLIVLWPIDDRLNDSLELFEDFFDLQWNVLESGTNLKRFGKWNKFETLWKVKFETLRKVEQKSKFWNFSGIGIPYNLKNEAITYGYSLKAQYLLPDNIEQVRKMN